LIPATRAAKRGVLRVCETRTVDWDSVDATPLYEVVREQGPAPDAELMVRALERVFSAAREDASGLDHLAAAALCAIAYRDGTSPRLVAEQLFRRGPSDHLWQERYAGLLVG